MALPTTIVNPGTGQTINSLQSGGQNTGANSHPVVWSSDQTPTVGSVNIATGQVTVGTSSSIIVAARTGVAGNGRIAATVVNMGTATVYIGNTSGVTVSNGFPVPAQAAISLNTMSVIYGISGTASQTVGYVETY